MLPEFPKFKKLELSDHKEVELFTCKYPPYSDFNFEILWTWDIDNSVEISKYNQNLIIRLKDPFTDKVQLSFLGNNKINETLAGLFDHFEDESPDPQLSLVPEDCLKDIDFNSYFIEIDLNSCDYIYDLKHLAEYLGRDYMKKRGKSNSFARNYPNAEVKVLDLKSKSHVEEILGLNDSWVENKAKNSDALLTDKELRAINRFINAHFDKTLVIGIYVESKLIACSIFTFHGNDYVISHFTKANVSYKGVYEYLIQKSANILKDLEYSFLNYQEDMGLEGLRMAKNSYKPMKFLKKYFVKKL